MDNIITNIKAIIQEKGLKQKFVASKAGFTPQEFSSILCGRKSFVCAALGITPNELFGIKEAS